MTEDVIDGEFSVVTIDIRPAPGEVQGGSAPPLEVIAPGVPLPPEAPRPIG